MIDQGKSGNETPRDNKATLSLDEIIPVVDNETEEQKSARISKESEDRKIEEEAKRKYEEMIRERRDHLRGLRDKLIAQKNAERQNTLRAYTKEKPKAETPVVVPKLDEGKMSLTKALATKIKQELAYEEATTPRVT